MKILYFGIYDPKYSRNAVIIKGLRENGIDVLECRYNRKGALKFICLFWRYWRFFGKYDIMIIGFPGHEVMFLARFLTRKPIIFDAFTSHYGGYILDRKYYSKRSPRAYYYRFLDKWSCRLADLVLLDTQAHIDFFIKEFGLPPEKFKRIWVGADDNIFYRSITAQKENEIFTVLFFGTFIPLQGAEHIIRAAKILEKENVIFHIIGDGQEKPMAVSLARGLKLKNVIFTGMISPEDLRSEIEGADVCLGIFGDTPKTPLVIPNKVYIALAVGKPVITADTPAIRELFDEKDLLFVKAASPRSLADGIIKLKDHPALRESLAQNGFSKFAKFASPNILGQELMGAINELRGVGRS
jgi:glycosyltransferase involved in cell wall biosynthesis